MKSTESSAGGRWQSSLSAGVAAGGRWRRWWWRRWVAAAAGGGVAPIAPSFAFVQLRLSETPVAFCFIPSLGASSCDRLHCGLRSLLLRRLFYMILYIDIKRLISSPTSGRRGVG